MATGYEIRLRRLGFEGVDGAGGVASEVRVLRNEDSQDRLMLWALTGRRTRAYR